MRYFGKDRLMVIGPDIEIPPKEKRAEGEEPEHILVNMAYGEDDDGNPLCVKVYKDVFDGLHNGYYEGLVTLRLSGEPYGFKVVLKGTSKAIPYKPPVVKEQGGDKRT